jgi:hypothetical protein
MVAALLPLVLGMLNGFTDDTLVEKITVDISPHKVTVNIYIGRPRLNQYDAIGGSEKKLVQWYSHSTSTTQVPPRSTN